MCVCVCHRMIRTTCGNFSILSLEVLLMLSCLVYESWMVWCVCVCRRFKCQLFFGQKLFTRLSKGNFSLNVMCFLAFSRFHGFFTHMCVGVCVCGSTTVMSMSLSLFLLSKRLFSNFTRIIHWKTRNCETHRVCYFTSASRSSSNSKKQ